MFAIYFNKKHKKQKKSTALISIFTIAAFILSIKMIKHNGTERIDFIINEIGLFFCFCINLFVFIEIIQEKLNKNGKIAVTVYIIIYISGYLIDSILNIGIIATIFLIYTIIKLIQCKNTKLISKKLLLVLIMIILLIYDTRLAYLAWPSMTKERNYNFDYLNHVIEPTNK